MHDALQILRSEPRFTARFDFNLQWLWPRDVMWDAFDRGVFPEGR